MGFHGGSRGEEFFEAHAEVEEKVDEGAEPAGEGDSAGEAAEGHGAEVRGRREDADAGVDALDGEAGLLELVAEAVGGPAAEVGGMAVEDEGAVGGEVEEAAGAEEAERFAEVGGDVGDVLEDLGAEDEIDAGVGQGDAAVGDGENGGVGGIDVGAGEGDACVGDRVAVRGVAGAEVERPGTFQLGGVAGQEVADAFAKDAKGPIVAVEDVGAVAIDVESLPEGLCHACYPCADVARVPRARAS